MFKHLIWDFDGTLFDTVQDGQCREKGVRSI